MAGRLGVLGCCPGPNCRLESQNWVLCHLIGITEDIGTHRGARGTIIVVPVEDVKIGKAKMHRRYCERVESTDAADEAAIDTGRSDIPRRNRGRCLHNGPIYYNISYLCTKRRPLPPRIVADPHTEAVETEAGEEETEAAEEEETEAAEETEEEETEAAEETEEEETEAAEETEEAALYTGRSDIRRRNRRRWFHNGPIYYNISYFRTKRRPFAPRIVADPDPEAVEAEDPMQLEQHRPKLLLQRLEGPSSSLKFL
ncbi:unnamed protein product [Sphagnum jensenii]|uniref:Uncharacterized protein n=1 Tax=Sphagnum jensenii TaxID=128206 RepID=A0ABP1AND0_9BRYO